MGAFDARTREALRRLEWQVRHRHLGSPFGGRHRSAFRGRGMEFDDVTQYAFGDDIRDVDWNVTARRGEPFRKRYTAERDATVFVVVNDEPALQFGSGSVSKREVLLELAALMLMLAVVHRERAALLHVTPHTETFMAPTRLRARISAFMADMLAAPAPAAAAPPNPARSPLLGARAPKGALLAYFGDTPGMLADHRWAVLCRRNPTIGVRVEDAWERSGPSIDRFTAYDPCAHALAWISASAAARQAHAAWRVAREQRWLAWWPNAAARLTVDAADEPLRAFTRFMRAGA